MNAMLNPVKPVLPPPLRPGDSVGVFYPAGPVRDQACFDAGMAILRDMGLLVRHAPPAGSGPDYLAADDATRLQELHGLWADDSIRALVAARGGFGCLRIAGALDFDFISSHPKWLIGFSDLTVLLNAVSSRTGLITMHGPVVTTLSTLQGRAMEIFQEMLAGRFRPFSQIPGLEILRGGIAGGPLIGGNLATLVHCIGTPWLPDFNGAVLFLEDTGEPEYKIDRMLTQLSCCGLLDGLSGLVLGNFDPGHDDRLEIIRRNEQVWNRVLELTQAHTYPVWGGFPAGHQGEQYPLPIGMDAVMNSLNGSLEFMPPSRST
jgi:muramoyltetrapeptide carboxypeptidase